MKIKSIFKKFILIVIPVLIFVSTTAISTSLFNKDWQQTYDKAKFNAQRDVQRLAEEIDYSSNENDGLTENQRVAIRVATENMNRQEGVFAYAIDKNLNLVTNIQDENIDEELLYEYTKEHIKDYENNDTITNGEFNTIISDKKVDIYLQKIPTKNTEYYICISVCRDMLKVNPAIETFRILVTILNIALSFSVAFNIIDIENKNNN